MKRLLILLCLTLGPLQPAVAAPAKTSKSAKAARPAEKSSEKTTEKPPEANAAEEDATATAEAPPEKKLSATERFGILPAQSTEGPGLSVEDCVRIALESNARIFEAEARVHEYTARLAQVQANFYPRISGMGYLAPMYTVHGDIFYHRTEWKSLSDWGPYAHLQATFAQPIYTFGRAGAAKTAGSERAEVEKARLRETQNVIAWETRKFYYTYLYASSLVPTLEQAETYVSAALEKAQELYDTGAGEVAQSDVSRLRFSLAQVHRFQILAINGSQVALVALKHTMGLASNANLKVADASLAPIGEEPRRELAAYIADAANNRPEWQQLAHGKAAAKALSITEIKANLPVLAIAGQFGADWAPTRDNAENPYWSDQYNRVTGGLALALIFDINPWMAQAKADTADAQFEQLEALERFASTGIPLQVLNAWVDLEQARRIVDTAGDAIQATRKWTTFAANAYDTGTGEPRDLLEGLAALLESRRMYYDALRDFYLAKAELLYATGTH